MRLVLAALLTLSVFASLPGPAVAGTASIAADGAVEADGYRNSGTVALYEAGPGERNRVHVRFHDEFTEVRDEAGVQPGAGCQALEPPVPTMVRCRAVGLDDCSDADCEPSLFAFLGDGDDEVSLDARVSGPFRDAGAVLFGGPGDDVLRGWFRGPHVFVGGDGDDRMISRNQGDLFDEGERRNGSDTLIARGGLDTRLSYAKRRHGVRLSLNGRRDDGEPGERDDLRGSDVVLVGGSGRDRLVGNRGDNELIGGPGRDVLLGGAGNDVLKVDGDGPLLVGRHTTADVADGGPGRDFVYGNAGPNRLSGGPGPDDVFAGDGRDVVVDRDRSADRVSCGRGRDVARLDARDFFGSGSSTRCERVRRLVPASGVPVVGASENIDVVGGERRADVAVGCPGDGPRTCRGTVKLMRDGRALASGRLRIRRGRITFVSLRVTRTGRRVISRRCRMRTVVDVRTVAFVRSRDRRGVVRTVRVRGFGLACAI